MSSRWIRVALFAGLASAAFLGAACDGGAKQAQPVQPAADKPATADAGQAQNEQKPADPTAQTPTEAPKTGPVARVNGVDIPRDAYNTEIDGLKKRFAMFGGNIPEAQLAKFQQRILDRMVEDALIDQKLAKENITVPDEEIEKELATYRERTPGGPDKFEEFLQKSGKTLDDLKTDVRKRLALRAFLNKDKALEITEEESKDYYEKNKARFTTKERVKAAHILIKLEENADDAKKAEARKKIDEIYKEATKPGADFEALAKAKSEGPSAPRGGDLGWFTRGRMVKEFEETAFGMKPGEVSKPVQTKFGWHVLKVYEAEQAGEKKFEEVQEDISKRLEARKFREAREKFIDDLKKEGKVEILEKIVIPATPASAPGIPGMPPGMPAIKKIEVNKPGTDGTQKIEVKPAGENAPQPTKVVPPAPAQP